MDIKERAAAAGCPFTDFAVAPSRPIGSYHEYTLGLREGGPIWCNTQSQGFWMLTQRELVQEMVTTPEIFSTESISPQEPNQHFVLIPGNIDPPLHRSYRSPLDPWFSPKAIREYEPLMRADAQELLKGFIDNGKVDISTDYCMSLATGAYLGRVGLPLTDRQQFMVWVDDWFRGFSMEEAHSRGDGKQPRFEKAIKEVETYMQDVVDDRRANPKDPSKDLFTALTQHRIDGELLSDEDLAGYTLLLFLGGLDTSGTAMAWMFYRLAQRPDDVKRLIENPELIPKAVEECLRFDTIVMGAGRKVCKDVNWHGVELRKGDMVWGLLNPSNHDPKNYDNPDEFILDRDPAHLAFSGGIHRCVGSHFARSQMIVALEEFLKLAPEFELDPSGDEIKERGVVMALNHVPLRWKI